ncbi:hypothetical protein NW249_26215 [Streptomyces sp. OUCMDZ-4982]|uniref:hypothetical protein n=1 Tax=Streptomyces sp. OUCMDZ-4982 TaxID=2973090 RepID=UPI00215D5031|nr:hypothetical protein [Streptomyces sp. OUCMDZ-4982]MCR8945606.1 hypothetical protein [Streptomyces sp. OUCMDZ-4982]
MSSAPASRRPGSPGGTSRSPWSTPGQGPLAYSVPYGQDGGIIRTVAQGHVTAVILRGHDTATMTVFTVAYAGTA